MILHEQFELEILRRMQSGRLLDALVFTGGTMLRLCHGLERYSVDLDFRAPKNGMDWTRYARSLKEHLSRDYRVVDAANKRYSIVVELKSPAYPRSLKIEIRKDVSAVKTEMNIAYSPASTIQVIVKTVALDEMMKMKIEAFLNRKEIRDAYDLEFLIKRGIKFGADAKTAGRLLTGVEELGKKDFSVKLGALLPADLRKYYRQNGFKILRTELTGILNNSQQ
ncbi:MAG TPA: nucleotidyl transferase AbiEii/AbiGii toxin family protein [Smithellaceae bacterium]|nr:nucleotidyl transferase AbiEii/AbiGii toxin family protein [Smithellaceae bacterium]